MHPRAALPCLALLLLLPTVATAGGELGPSPLEPPSTGGLETLDRAAARLTNQRRLLMVGAHPDDEDNTLLTLVSRQLGGEAAYLALCRGEGGQNLIGDELGVDLGLLRTQELLAARRLEGSRQFFTRAYDFGYTRSVEETFRRWPRQTLLEDAVRVIRRFRPQVIVSVFPAEPRGGHGQHAAAGDIAHAAFTAAADPEAFPQLLAEGLAPWRAQSLWRLAWFDPDSATLELPLDWIDPWRGKSVLQLAMASRSMHRSQDMGNLQATGRRSRKLTWVAGPEGPESSGLFAGIDTDLAGLAALLEEGELRTRITARLERVQALAHEVRRNTSALSLEAQLPVLRRLLSLLRQVRWELEAVPASAWGEETLAELLGDKIDATQAAVATAGGLILDATAESETLVPGQTAAVKVEIWNAGSSPLRIHGVELRAADAWDIEGSSGASSLAPGELGEWSFQVTLPATAEPTVPYFLRRPLQGDLYDWSHAPSRIQSEPFGPPPLVAHYRLQLGGARLELRREVVYRYRDQARGEVRRPLRVVPALEVAVKPDLVVWSTREEIRQALEVSLVSHLRSPLEGEVEVQVPAVWPPPATTRFRLPPGGRGGVSLELSPPPDLSPGRYHLELVATSAGGRSYGAAFPLVDYPHIRPVPRTEAAHVEVTAVDLLLPDLDRVGYIRGASDRVPEALRQVGVPLQLLTPPDLARLELALFDAIVVGSRAYEVAPELREVNDRLLNYVRAGGVLIVQYQQYPFVEGGVTPYPLTIARPHDRVTDETAPVRLLEPSHPVFREPNRITAVDWAGWVQERGLYFAHEWDQAYRPLLAISDPGGPELRGSLLVATLGQGTYVYTGLAFFRQLPAGVGGAYRLFANLLALGT